ncbi:MAG TPA: SpoIIE family protein phosphatase [Acidobacteriota bacterium]|nr:SpoIIE family protein phosphatase [Acidobacteriota bacterium]
MKIVRRRKLIILLLAAFILTFRGMALHQLYFSRHIPWGIGFTTDVRGGRLVVETVTYGDISGNRTPAERAGLQVGDELLEVYNPRGEGGQVEGFADWGERLRNIERKSPWRVVIERVDQEGNVRRMTLDVPPSSGFMGDLRTMGLSLTLNVLLPLIAVVTGLLVGLMKPNSRRAFVASLMFFAFTSLFWYPHYTFPPGFREAALLIQTTLNSFLVYLFMWFFLVFPSASTIERRFPYLRKIFLGFTVVLWLHELALLFVSLYSFKAASKVISWGSLSRISAVVTVAMFLVGLTSLVLNTLQARSKDERRRMSLILYGTVIGLVPVSLFLAAIGFMPLFNPPWWLLSLVALSLAVFPLSFVYAVVKHRVLGIRLIVRRGLQYALISRGFLVIEGGVVFLAILFGLGPFFRNQLPSASTTQVVVMTSILTLSAVFVLRHVNRKVMPVIDRRFFREAYNARQILSDLTRTVRRLVGSPEELIRVVSEKISESLYPRTVAIFIRVTETSAGQTSGEEPLGPGSEFHCAILRRRSPEGKETVSSLESNRRFRLSGDSFLARYLDRFRTSEPKALDVYFDDPNSWTQALVGSQESEKLYNERRLLEDLGARLIIPLVSRDRVFGFILLGEKMSEEPFSAEDKELLLTVGEQASVALDYASLVRQLAEQESLRRELEIAKEVQSKLFPQRLPAVPGLDYAGTCRPARGVGGDYYDFLQLSDHQLCLAVGDISGKGISAALLMASMQALLRSKAPVYLDSLDELIAEINSMMCESTATSKYATLFCAVYDRRNRTLTYVNAGHNPPMLFRTRGHSGLDLIRLQTGGTIVGMFENASYKKETIELEPEDLLVIFTDGITEAVNSRGEEFGEARLEGVIRKTLNRDATHILNAILDATAQFSKDIPQADDQTLLVARVVAS